MYHEQFQQILVVVDIHMLQICIVRIVNRARIFGPVTENNFSTNLIKNMNRYM